MWKGKKRSKDPRQMISAIRKFLSGEDVVKEIIEKTIDPIEGMVLVNVKPPSWQDNQEDAPAWWEHSNVHVINMVPFEGTYPDPEIEGIRYKNPANVPKMPDNSERINSSRKIERQKIAPIKPVEITQAEKDEQERQERVLQNRLQQEKILKIREEFNWHDVPFSSWINQLSRR